MPGLGRFAKQEKKQQDRDQPSSSSPTSSGKQMAQDTKENEHPIDGNVGTQSLCHTTFEDHSNASNGMFRENLSCESANAGAPDFERFSMGFHANEYDDMGNDVDFDSMVLEGFETDIVSGYPVDQVSDFDLNDNGDSRQPLEDSNYHVRSSIDDRSSNGQATGAIAKFQRNKDSKMSDIPSSASNGDVQINTSNSTSTITSTTNMVSRSDTSSIPRPCTDDSKPLPLEVSPNTSSTVANKNHGQSMETSSNAQFQSTSTPLKSSVKNSFTDTPRNDGQYNETESNVQGSNLVDAISLPHESYGSDNGQIENYESLVGDGPFEKLESNNADSINHAIPSNKENASANYGVGLHRDVNIISATDFLNDDCPSTGTLHGKNKEDGTDEAAHPDMLYPLSGATSTRTISPTLIYERRTVEEQDDGGHSRISNQQHKSDENTNAQNPKLVSISRINDTPKGEHRKPTTDTSEGMVLVANNDALQDNHQLRRHALVLQSSEREGGTSYPDCNNSMKDSKMTFCRKKHSIPMDIERVTVQDTAKGIDLQSDNSSAMRRDNSSMNNGVKHKSMEPNPVKPTQHKLQTHGTVEVARDQTAPCAKEYHTRNTVLPVTPSPPPPVQNPTRRRTHEDSIHENRFISPYHKNHDHDHVHSPYNQTNTGKLKQPTLHKKEDYLKQNDALMTNATCKNIPSRTSNQNHTLGVGKQDYGSFSGIVSPAPSAKPPNHPRQEQNFDDLLAAFTEDLVAAGDIWDRCDSQMVDLNVKLCISQNVALRLQADFDDILEEVESILESWESE